MQLHNRNLQLEKNRDDINRVVFLLVGNATFFFAVKKSEICVTLVAVC